MTAPCERFERGPRHARLLRTLGRGYVSVGALRVGAAIKLLASLPLTRETDEPWSALSAESFG